MPVRTSRAASAHAGPGWAPATWEERDQGKAQQRASEQGPEVLTSKPHANASRQAWPSLRCSFAADSVRSQAKPRRARRCEARGTLRPSVGLVGNVISHPGPQPSIHAHPGLGPLWTGWSQGVSLKHLLPLLFPPWGFLGPHPYTTPQPIYQVSSHFSPRWRGQEYG